MFISEEEAKRRIENTELLIRRLPSAEQLSPPEPLYPPTFNIDELFEKDSSEEGEFQGGARALNRLLNPIPKGPRGFSRDEQAAHGVTASIIGTTKASRLHDIAISTAHSNERGYTNPVDLVNPDKTPKQDLVDKIIAGHGIVVEKCFDRLLKTLDLLDDEKLEKMQKPTEISLVARNLSGIVAQATQATQERVQETSNNNVHFHIMRPEQATDDEYPTIDVSKVGVVS